MPWTEEHRVKGGNHEYRRVIPIINAGLKVPSDLFALTSPLEKSSVKLQKCPIEGPVVFPHFCE